MTRWTPEDIVTMANAIWWSRRRDSMRAIGIYTLEDLLDRERLDSGTVWHPGDGTENDPPIFAEELYLHEITALTADLEASIPRALRTGSNFGPVKKETE